MDLKTLSKCFLRTYLMGSVFNTRGLQNVGLIYALDPALKKIYSEGKSLQRARRRHVRLYNSHPFWNPLLVGIFIYLERKTAKGLLPEEMIGKTKSTVVYTLSALGDSFFGGSLLVTWALGVMIIWYSGLGYAAAFLTIFCLIALQLFKIYTFYKGVTRGIAFLNRLKGWDLINCGIAVKMLNAALLLMFLVFLWPPGVGFPFFAGFAAGLCLFAYAVFKLPVCREACIAVFLAGGIMVCNYYSVFF